MRVEGVISSEVKRCERINRSRLTHRHNLQYHILQSINITVYLLPVLPLHHVPPLFLFNIATHPPSSALPNGIIIHFTSSSHCYYTSSTSLPISLPSDATVRLPFPYLLLQRCYYSYSQSILLPHLFYPPPLPFNILLYLSFSLSFTSLLLDINTLLYLSISQAAAASLCSSIARSRRDTLSLCASVSWDALKS